VLYREGTWTSKLVLDLEGFLVKIDDFIEREIKPLEQENGNTGAGATVSILDILSASPPGRWLSVKSCLSHGSTVSV
jgi:hypothetical protein